jgi:hypothetical protein
MGTHLHSRDNTSFRENSDDDDDDDDDDGIALGYGLDDQGFESR